MSVPAKKNGSFGKDNLQTGARYIVVNLEEVKAKRSTQRATGAILFGCTQRTRGNGVIGVIVLDKKTINCIVTGIMKEMRKKSTVRSRILLSLFPWETWSAVPPAERRQNNETARADC